MRLEKMVQDMTEPKGFLTWVNEIPKEERWLWEDPIALETVMRGLEDAKEGRISKIDAELLRDEELDIEDDLIPDF